MPGEAKIMAQGRQGDSSSQIIPETTLDGVRYARLQVSGTGWLLGSLKPDWQADLPPAGKNPDSQTLENLATRNIFLARGEKPRVCVMCCGLGSAWPGMGRELYDQFPAARQAMDRLAAYVDWDILSIMDETDPELLNHPKIQIPYLYMLEYAQWNQLISLGLQPDLVCGHSLGELVALNLSGAYPLETAWHLFERRSSHMALLEETSASESGMLTISADYPVIEEALRKYPDLYISNINTSHQYILSGPRPTLLELRKQLRRSHIPAFMLGINIAFHNPAMRVLRDLSLRRLNGLEMRAPEIPLLSCVTAQLYPGNQEEICRNIADLDENTVDWPKSVNTIYNDFGIKHFIELGPQETLCGLVSEIRQDSRCFSASRKGHEAQAMRQLCARLYSLGLLKDSNIASLAARKSLASSGAYHQAGYPPEKMPEAGLEKKSPEWDIVMELLARETGRPVSELTPDLDLRYDLALRSSRFPYLVQEAERRFNRQIALENLLQISTVGDLANFLTGAENRYQKSASSSNILPFRRPSRLLLLPLAAYAFKKNNTLEPWYPNPDKTWLLHRLTNTVALCVLDEILLPYIWSGLASFPLKLLVPSFLLEKCAPLKKSGNILLPLEINRETDPVSIPSIIKKAGFSPENLSGILYVPPPLDENSDPAKYLSVVPDLKAFLPKNGWLCLLQRQTLFRDLDRDLVITRSEKYFSLLTPSLPGEDKHTHIILWLDQREIPELQNQNEAGDMLARELLYSSPARIVWLSTPLSSSPNQSLLYCPSAECMNNIQAVNYSDQTPPPSCFRGEGQFSSFREPALASHGSVATKSPSDIHQKNDPGLPLGHILKTLLVTSRLVCPWLYPFAISDAQIESLPPLPYGITREFRVEAQATQWIMQEKIPTRLCHSSISMRELSANGRRTQDWNPVAKALCSLGRPGNNSIKIYPELAMPDGPYFPLSDQLFESFYRSMRFGPEWICLQDFKLQSSPERIPSFYQAKIGKIPDWIAGYSEWEYNNFAYLIEAVYQACILALITPPDAGDRNILLNPDIWRCRRIGFIRFADFLGDYTANLVINFSRSWNESGFTRFDGMINTESRKTILSFLHFEFDRINHDQ